MGKKKGNQMLRQLLLLGLTSFLLLGGCSVSDGIHRAVELDVQALFKLESKLMAHDQNRTDPTGVLRLSKAEAICQALKANTVLHSLKQTYQRNRIEIEQAKSNVLPRILAKASVEIPIGGDSDDEDESFEAGLFATYDILEAVLAKDAVSIEKVKAAKLALKVIEEARRTYHQLTRQLHNLNFIQKEMAIYGNALSTAHKAFSQARRFKETNPQAMQTLNRWEREVVKSQSALQIAEMRMQTEKRRLRRLMGIKSGVDIEVLDWETLLPVESWTFDASDDRFLNNWTNRTDIQQKKMDLILADLGVAGAKRNRWPSLHATLGVGRIQTDDSDDTAPLLPTFSLSMPILDMGDAKRTVARARIESDLARERLGAVARSTVDRYQQAKLGLNHARKRKQMAHDTLALISKQIDSLEKLVSVNRAELMALYNARYQAATAHIAVIESDCDMRLAALELQTSLEYPDPVKLSSILNLALPSESEAKPFWLMTCQCSSDD